MLVSGIFLTTNDSITKWLVPHYPAGEILFVQGTLIAHAGGGWMRLRGEHPLRVVRWRAHLYRGLMYATGSFAFVYALRHLPLAEVIAIAFAGPLFMTLFGKLFLTKPSGPHRLGAVVVGFIGILIVIRPGTAAMHWAALLPLIVALSGCLSRPDHAHADARRIVAAHHLHHRGNSGAGGRRDQRRRLATRCARDLLWFGCQRDQLRDRALFHGRRPFGMRRLSWLRRSGTF